MVIFNSYFDITRGYHLCTMNSRHEIHPSSPGRWRLHILRQAQEVQAVQRGEILHGKATEVQETHHGVDHLPGAQVPACLGAWDIPSCRETTMMFCLRDLWDSKLDSPAVTGFPLCVYIYIHHIYIYIYTIYIYIPYIYIGIPYKYQCDVYLLAISSAGKFPAVR